MEAGTQQQTAPEDSGRRGERTEGMETITTILRQAREHKGVSLKDVEGKTRIPLKYLQALEGESENGLLADEVYLIPFLRSYANFLGVDANQAVTRFLTELQQQDAATVAPPEHRPPVVRPRSGPSRLAAWIVPFLSLLVVLVIGSYLWQQGHWQTLLSWWQAGPANEERNSESPVSTASSPTAAVVIPESPVAVVPPPSDTSGSNVASPVTSAGSAPTQESATDVAPAPPTSPASAVAVVPPSSMPTSQGTQATSSAAPPTAVTEVPQAGTPAVAAVPSTTTAVPAGGHRLTILANAQTWMRVVVDSQPGKEMILKAGESREWTAESGFMLSLGNAGGVTLNLDGQELPPAGKSGQVVKTMRLPAAQ